MNAQELREQAACIIKTAERLEASEELCNHRWSGDPAWECYCTGCSKHILEVHSEAEILFAKDAYCHECKKTAEEKETERIKKESARRERELKQLAELKAKYPDAQKAKNLGY